MTLPVALLSDGSRGVPRAGFPCWGTGLQPHHAGAYGLHWWPGPEPVAGWYCRLCYPGGISIPVHGTLAETIRARGLRVDDLL